MGKNKLEGGSLLLFKKLVEHSPECPVDFAKFLCNMWLEFTAADWVWLWVHNPALNTWELRTVKSKTDERILPSFEAKLETSKSVADYCTETGECVADVFPFNWLGRTNAQSQFSVTSREELAKLGCKSFVCVPLASHFPQYSKCDENLVAALCVHFNDQRAGRIDHEQLAEWAVFGKLCHKLFEDAYRVRHERLLTTLNSLSAECMTILDVKPATMRLKFIRSVIGLVKEEMKCRAVSLFSEGFANDGSIRCIGTTGTLFSTERQVMLRGNELSEAIYRPGVGATGAVLSSGRFKILDPRIAKDSDPALSNRTQGTFVECVNEEKLSGKSVAICPLLSKTRGDVRVMGVLRCVDSRVEGDGFNRTCFDGIDINALNFISEQVSPVLEALNSRVDRERQISIVKHDLLGPVAIIRHIADSLETSVLQPDSEKPRSIPYRKLMNIKAFAVQASHLVAQLDPELNKLHSFNPIPTKMEKDIVARVLIVLRFMAKEENQMSIRFGDFSHFPVLNVDRVMVERVLFNLVVNAIKYGEARSEITIQYRKVSKGIAIDVTNKGIGVAESDKEKIFLESYRSVTKHQRVMGLGLGLFIARNAMRMHNGDLLLHSPRDSTTFRMFFPDEIQTFHKEK